MNIIKAFATVSFFTLLSRIVGFARDIIIAAFLGSSVLAEAFFVALRLPNMFRSLFAEGAFNAAFVPLFSKKLDQDGETKARLFAGNIMLWLFSVLLLFTLIAQLCMPWFLMLLAPGFKENATHFELAVSLARITFPYLLCISLVALMGGMLNAFDRFAAVAVTPVILNLCLIISLPLLAPLTSNPAYALSWGVFIAGILQLAWLFWQLRKQHKTPLLNNSKAAEAKNGKREFLRKLAPGILGSGVVQLSVWIDTIIASFISAAIAYLYYAERIYQLPLALIGSAMGVALLPSLTKAIAAKDNHKIDTLNERAALTVLLFALPAMVGMFVLANPIIHVLFERGAFDSASTQGTALALMCYAPALPAIVLNRVAINNFFARGDTATPVKLALLTLGNKLCFALGLLFLFSKTNIPNYLSLPLSTSLSAWFYVCLTHRALHKRNHKILKAAMYKKIGFVTLIACLMGVFIWKLTLLFPANAFGLGITIIAAIGFYFGLLHATNIMPLKQWKNLLKDTA